MKLHLFAIAVLLATSSAAPAQERTAGQSQEPATDWSGLESLVNATTTTTDSMTTRMNRLVTCGKKGRVYAPAHPTHDADGCAEASNASLITQINQLTTIINTIGMPGARSLRTSIVQNTSAGSGHLYADVMCPGTTKVLGGGVRCNTNGSGNPATFVRNNQAITFGQGWQGSCAGKTDVSGIISVYAICGVIEQDTSTGGGS